MSLPTPEQRVRRARTILRAIWQGFDAAGHSCGRSRTCGLLELAMQLIGPPDPTESEQADADLSALVAEAREWLATINEAETEAYFQRFFAQEASAMEPSSSTRQIAAEVESGFESRMR